MPFSFAQMNRRTIMNNIKKLSLLLILPITMTLGGCTAIALVDAAASTAVGAGKLAVKGTTAAVGAVIPDGDDDKKKKKN